MIVGLAIRGQSIDAELVELAELARTAGAQVAATVVQKVDRLDAAVWMGRGKSEMVAERLKSEGFRLVIFNGSLSPTQIRNLQDLFGTAVKVLDRPGLILDIFAKHARSRESKFRVELAQIQYFLPRMVGLRSHMDRQHGGIGTRGPGEAQIEVDRRAARKRLAFLQDEIDRMGRARAVQRSSRDGIPRVALIGYTNAGKSTLLNALTRAGVLAEDQLFSTLDTKTSALIFPSTSSGSSYPSRVLVSDTVGFIRNLPDHLYDAFLSTLDEVREADLLLQVIDVSNPEFRMQAGVVQEVIAKISAGGRTPPSLTVFNKSDRVEIQPEHLLREFPDAVFISARTGMGLSALREAIRQKILSGAGAAA